MGGRPALKLSSGLLWQAAQVETETPAVAHGTIDDGLCCLIALEKNRCDAAHKAIFVGLSL
jgi:hypothetical protein